MSEENNTSSPRAEFVKILPSLVWVAFAIVGFLILLTPIKDFSNAVSARVKSGAHMEIGPLKLQELKVGTQGIVPKSSEIAWEQRPDMEVKRQAVYEKTKEYFVAHKLYPSKEEGQTYDIWIYVIPHKKGIAEIESVSYFFGPAWGNKAFTSKDRGKGFGVLVSAYGPMLTYVEITLKSEEEVIETWSYIDFENGSLGSRGGV